MSARNPVDKHARRGFLDAYFGGFVVSRTKLALFRITFFFLVGIDALRQVPHAPRYGAGDFNVGHFGWLEAILPAPSRAAILVIFFWQAYLALFIAFGRATRAATILLTTLYGYAYFVSQLDSYQHHYLVFLLLLLASFVPWHDTEASANDASDTTQSWAMRLAIVQVAIVYLWAGITKLEEPWLDGTVLGAQLESGWTRDTAEWLGMGNAATLVTLAELFLFVALLWPRLWPYAVIVGCGLHAGIEFGAEFKIGIFSYYMFAFYLLLLPDRWYARLARALEPVRRALEPLRSWLAERRPVEWSIAGFALVAGSLCFLMLPIDQATILSVTCALFALATYVWALFRSRARSRASSQRAGTQSLVLPVAHLLACALIVSWPWTADSVGDYYKYWGGSARRLGQWDEAEIAYRHLVRLRPTWAPGHYHLARIEERNGDMDAALAGYERAQEANPSDYRSFLGAAAIHHSRGHGHEAATAARRALALLRTMPATTRTNNEIARARQIVESWPGVGPAPPAP